MAATTKVDGTAYVKFNQSYLKSLHVPAWESAAFTQAGDTGFAEAGTVTVEGQPALALTQSNATDGATVYVSDSAIPEILSLGNTGGQEAFLDFTNFNAPVTITAPQPRTSPSSRAENPSTNLLRARPGSSTSPAALFARCRYAEVVEYLRVALCVAR